MSLRNATIIPTEASHRRRSQELVTDNVAKIDSASNNIITMRLDPSNAQHANTEINNCPQTLV